MPKLIRTNLLRKHHHTSDVAFATSSALDYCLYRRDGFFKVSPAEIVKTLLNAVLILIQTIVWVPCFITGGFLLFPLYAIQHHFLKKKLIKQYGVDKLNEGAEMLEKDFLNRQHKKD